MIIHGFFISRLDSWDCTILEVKNAGCSSNCWYSSIEDVYGLGPGYLRDCPSPVALAHPLGTPRMLSLTVLYFVCLGGSGAVPSLEGSGRLGQMKPKGQTKQTNQMSGHIVRFVYFLMSLPGGANWVNLNLSDDLGEICSVSLCYFRQ